MIMENYLQKRREAYEKYIDQVVKYYEKFGDISKVYHIDSYESDGEVIDIGYIISNLRMAKSGKSLDPDQVQRLEQMGMNWDIHEAYLSESIFLLQEYYKEKGSLRDIPFLDFMEYYYMYKGKEVPIGMMYYEVRKAFDYGELDDEKVKALREMGVNLEHGRPAPKNVVKKIR